MPAVGVVCHGFEVSARVTARGEGVPDARFVVYPPPNIGTHLPEDIQERAEGVLNNVIKAFGQPVTGAGAKARRLSSTAHRETVVRGTLSEVNDSFRENGWTDGLPIMPPTLEAVEAMLEGTNRSPDEVLGHLPPSMGAATVWKIAVNAVMAGCRPEYMPVLLAVVEAIADQRFGLRYAGSTLGWTPLIILSGPIVKTLDFNSGAGVLRPWKQANITVGRFLRLCMTNIAGFAVGTTDMGTFGRNYHAVLAEAVDESPWGTLAEDLGYPAGSSIVAVLSEADMGYHFITRGTPEQHLQRLARETTRVLGGPPILGLTHFGPEWAPVVCVSPLLASILAEGGYSKKDFKRYLFDHVRITASEMEEQMQHLIPGYTLCEAVKQGKLDGQFCADDDPNRLVPVATDPDDFKVVVSGHANMCRVLVVAQLGFQGQFVSREVRHDGG
ncbi:MAG: hypothetical protein HY675_12610 [Chloroflexi bacterium]|nr:hypothetical protein [Chloroflexota bacterium]